MTNVRADTTSKLIVSVSSDAQHSFCISLVFQIIGAATLVFLLPISISCPLVVFSQALKFALLSPYTIRTSKFPMGL